MRSTKKSREFKYSHSAQEARKVIGNASKEAVDDLRLFKTLIEGLSETASKKTHYQDLDKWDHSVYEYLHEMLKKYGFVNGNPDANALIPDANFWWKIYGVVSSVIYSPHLKSEVSSHHSSAFERNSALVFEITDVLKAIES